MLLAIIVLVYRHAGSKINLEPPDSCVLLLYENLFTNTIELTKGQHGHLPHCMRIISEANKLL